MTASGKKRCCCPEPTTCCNIWTACGAPTRDNYQVTWSMSRSWQELRSRGIDNTTIPPLYDCGTFPNKVVASGSTLVSIAGQINRTVIAQNCYLYSGTCAVTFSASATRSVFDDTYDCDGLIPWTQFNVSGNFTVPIVLRCQTGQAFSEPCSGQPYPALTDYAKFVLETGTGVVGTATGTGLHYGAGVSTPSAATCQVSFPASGFGGPFSIAEMVRIPCGSSVCPSDDGWGGCANHGGIVRLTASGTVVLSAAGASSNLGPSSYSLGGPPGSGFVVSDCYTNRGEEFTRSLAIGGIPNDASGTWHIGTEITTVRLT